MGKKISFENGSPKHGVICPDCKELVEDLDTHECDKE